MAKDRDEFPSAVKENLAKRAGQRCSNPDCGATTSGPHQDECKAINVGVTAHITAASPGGPRYNKFLAPEQRAAISNAIWLCQTCAKLIDSDVTVYTEVLIRLWKRRHEERITAEIKGASRFENNSRSPACLSVDAVFVNPSGDNKGCVLDIRVSNPGQSHLMLNAVKCEVLESVEMALLGHADYSAQYDLDIGRMRGYASRAECQVAQILAPGEADRFAIILSNPHPSTSVGGWRFATMFKTNCGNVRGPEIEVWLPRPDNIRSMDEVTSFWLANAQLWSFVTGEKFRKLAAEPADSFSRIERAGSLAYPSKTGGYETLVKYGTTLGIYRGPQPLWEKGVSSATILQSDPPEVLAGKAFYRLHGNDSLERAMKFMALAEQANMGDVEKWRCVVEQVKKLLKAKG